MAAAFQIIVCYFMAHFAAGILLVEEAGGQVRDYQGNPLIPTQPSDMFAHNGPIGARIAEAVSLEF